MMSQIIASSFIVVVYLFGLDCPRPFSNQGVQSLKADFSAEGIAQIITQLSNGTPVEIIARKSSFSVESFPYRTAFPHYQWAGWGAERSHPRTVLTSLDVKLGSKDVWVSLSSYSDLANPHLVLFQETTLDSDYPTFRVVVEGGDAATSYQAKMDFNTICLEHRLVLAGEFPLEQREETIYTITTPKTITPIKP